MSIVANIHTVNPQNKRLIFSGGGMRNEILDSSGDSSKMGVKVYKKGCSSFFSKFFRQATDIQVNGETYTVNKNDLDNLIARTTKRNSDAPIDKKMVKLAKKAFKTVVKEAPIGSKKATKGVVLQDHLRNFAHSKDNALVLQVDSDASKTVQKQAWSSQLRNEFSRGQALRNTPTSDTYDQFIDQEYPPVTHLIKQAPTPAAPHIAHIVPANSTPQTIIAQIVSKEEDKVLHDGLLALSKIAPKDLFTADTIETWKTFLFYPEATARPELDFKAMAYEAQVYSGMKPKDRQMFSNVDQIGDIVFAGVPSDSTHEDYVLDSIDRLHYHK